MKNTLAMGGRESLLPMFRQSVPERLRLPLMMVLPFVYQSSNPLYMNLAHQIAADTALREADVTMCGLACILGITATFPILFRLKFRFTTRQIIVGCSAAMAALGLCTTMATALPVLVLLSFIFGMFKLWGTFECMSSMMRSISPNMHLAPFLMVVFLAVFGGVEIGGMCSTWIAEAHGWRYANYAMCAVHIAVIVYAMLLMRNHRAQPAVPLRGIDWGGMALWGIFLVGQTAVFVYGEKDGWLHNTALAICLVVSLLALAAALYGTYHKKNAIIAPQCFRYRRLWHIMVLFFISGVMLSSQAVLQGALEGSLMSLSPMQSARLGWASLAGVVIGCVVAKAGLTRLRWNYKQLTALSLLLTTLYAAIMIPTCRAASEPWHLALPCLVAAAGHAMIFVVLTTYVETNTPFEHRFMMLTVLGLVRTGLATPIGCALYGHFLGTLSARHGTERVTVGVAVESGAEGLIWSMQWLYAATVALGVVALLIIGASHFEQTRYITLPTLRKINAALRNEK